MATKLKQYMFTFEEGGWNTVWAKSLPGARKQAIAEYKDVHVWQLRILQFDVYILRQVEKAWLAM